MRLQKYNFFRYTQQPLRKNFSEVDFVPLSLALCIALLSFCNGFVVVFDASNLVGKAADLPCPLVEIAGRFGRITLQRCRIAGRDEGRLAQGELVGTLVEIVLGGRLGAIDAGTHLYQVQVHLHDTLFAPESLNQKGEIDLSPFPYPGMAVPEEHVLGGLLRDGAGPTLALALFLLVDGLLHRSPVEAAVRQEIIVFGSHRTVGHIVGNLFDVAPLFLDREIIFDLADNHQGRYRRIDPAVGQRQQNAKDKQTQRNLSQQGEKTFQRAGCSSRFLRFFLRHLSLKFEGAKIR